MKSRRLILVAILLLSSMLSAQTFRGGIQGTVTDTSGAAVSGAEVTVTNEGTGLSRSAQTTDAGEYAITEQPIGSYSVSASRSGFQTQTVTGATVAVSAEGGLDPVTGQGVGFLGLDATPDVGIGNPLLGGGGPRNIQLGVRLTF